MPNRNESDPQWLTLLRGNFPLLERSQLEYISEVRRRIIQEAKDKPSLPCNQHLKYKLSLMIDNFEKVVQYLKENSGSKEYFLRTYPEWRGIRNLTILQLEGIAKSVTTDSQKCSVSRGVGSAVSFIGGLMCLATGGGLRLAGGALMGLGSVAAVGTSSVELELLRKKLKQAEKIIREDREYSEKLWNWISDVSYIQEALDVIRNVDVDMNFKKAANDFHVNSKKKSSKDELTMSIVKGMNFFLKVSPEIVKEVADVVGILVATSMLYDRYRPFFNQALQTYKCKKMLSIAYDVLGAAFRTTSAVNACKNSELTTLQKSKIVTGMVLDVISILLVSDGVNSTSKEAKAITKAAEKLQEEAEIFQKLYDSVSK